MRAAITIALLLGASSQGSALTLEWAVKGTGTVPGTTTGYTVTAATNGDLAIAAGSTFDGEHSWGNGGTLLRQTGGNVTATITFDAPVPVDQLTFAFNDVDSPAAVITLSVVGVATPADFAIDPGFTSRADFVYDGATGELTSPATDHSSQLFGTSSATATSLTLSTTGITGGDFTSARFGFVTAVPEPGTSALLACLGLLALVGRRLRRG